MSDFNPKIAWIILNYKNLTLTIQSVQTLIENTDIDQSIVIIDNGSDDEDTDAWYESIQKPPFDKLCHVFYIRSVR